MADESGPNTIQEDTDTRRVPVFHPVLLALYPILGLYAHNQDKTPFGAMFRSVVVVSIAVILIYHLFRLVYQTRYRAGAATSIVVVAMLSGWHILQYLMRLVLPQAAGLPNAVYLGAFAATAAAVVGLCAWWGRKRHEYVGIWIGLGIVGLVVTYVLADVVLRGQFARGPAWFMAVFFVVTAGLLIWVRNSKRHFRRLTITLNFFGVILLGLSGLNILYNRPPAELISPPPPMAEEVELDRGETPLPDIYFLVFGGHGRADIHLEMYGYNEQEFLQNMIAMGFRHIPFTEANYPNTLLSLTSCLNMDYLQRMYRVTEGVVPPAEIIDMYHNNRIFGFLRRNGYEIIATSQGMEVLDPRDSVDRVLRPVRALTEFEIVLLESSALSPLSEWIHSLLYGSDAELRNVIERGRIYQVLDQVQAIPSEPSDKPRFVFSVVPIPEAPFLFDRNGDWPGTVLTRTYAGRTEFTGTRDQFRRAYGEQLVFTNDLIEQMCARIAEESERPAVIIVASAHGPGVPLVGAAPEPDDLRERLFNTVLIRMPEDACVTAMAPIDHLAFVNLFRVVLNAVFGTEFETLPGETYLVTRGPSYTFMRVDSPPPTPVPLPE